MYLFFIVFLTLSWIQAIRKCFVNFYDLKISKKITHKCFMHLSQIDRKYWKYLKCPKIYLPKLSAQAQKFGILMKKRLHWASVVRDSTHQKKYPRKLFAKIRKILLFFSYFYPLKVFKNTFNNFSPLKLSWQLLTSNWQLSCFSSRSFLYIRFLPCDSIIRQKRATCHTEPVVIMYTRQKFSTPALSRHLSWTHNGVK